MLIQKLNSSALYGCEYDEDKGYLTIYFTDGREETYAQVPPEIYKNLVDAKSAGGYFNGFIRNDYPRLE